MENFAPLFVLLIVYFLVMGPISRLNRKKQPTGRQTGASRSAPTDPNGSASPADVLSAADPEEAPSRETVLAPTVSVTHHDDSVYQGSMNAFTGEGFDPCHEDQLAPLSAPEPEPMPDTAAVPGLQLSWTRSEIVHGFVMSEILKRKGSAS